MLFPSPAVLLGVLLTASAVSGLTEIDRNARRVATHELVRFEKRSDYVARNVLVKRGPAPGNSKFKLRIALRQEDPEQLEKTAIDIATPGHPRYRQHLTVDEVAHLTRPLVQAVDGVQSWLSDFGLSGTVDHDMVIVDATVEEAETLLDTKYHLYEHLETRELVVRTDEYSLPRSLHDMVDFVTPTTHVGLKRKRRSSSGQLKKRMSSMQVRQDTSRASSTPCGDATIITPDCVRYLYNITLNATSDGVQFAVYGTQESLFNETDLQTFLQLYNPPAAEAGATFDLIGLNSNSITDGFDQDEVGLDTQWTLGLAYPAKGLLYLNGDDGTDNFTGDAASDDHYLAFLHQLTYNDSVPSVITTSEEDNEGNISPAYMKRVCNGFAAAGARGITFLFSSGDAGIQGAGSPWAVYDLDASFPSTCPFVTSVGGTVVEPSLEETALTLQTSLVISSSGGFSTIFARPAYQDSAVLPYVATIDPGYANLTGYNGTTGRGFPDIAAVGFNCADVLTGDVGTGGGTSFSSPIIAALITILNDVEISRGRPPLGFINPWLYSNPGALNDVTTGGINVRPFEPGFPPGFVPYDGPLAPLGYNVSVGWDPVTGLGTPNFVKLLAVLD